MIGGQNHRVRRRLRIRALPMQQVQSAFAAGATEARGVVVEDVLGTEEANELGSILRGESGRGESDVGFGERGPLAVDSECLLEQGVHLGAQFGSMFGRPPCVHSISGAS